MKRLTFIVYVYILHAVLIWLAASILLHDDSPQNSLLRELPGGGRVKLHKEPGLVWSRNDGSKWTPGPAAGLGWDRATIDQSVLLDEVPVQPKMCEMPTVQLYDNDGDGRPDSILGVHDSRLWRADLPHDVIWRSHEPLPILMSRPHIFTNYYDDRGVRRIQVITPIDDANAEIRYFDADGQLMKSNTMPRADALSEDWAARVRVLNEE